MKSYKTSYDNEKNKEDAKIIFEAFPEKTLLCETKSEKKNNWVLYLLASTLLIILFVGSSILNQKILYGNESRRYKLVNKYDGNYAIIRPYDRSQLFKNIGFDISKTKVETKGDKSYITTYAYHNVNNEKGITDAISVYYDDDYSINYIVLSLMYKKNNFSISKTDADCNCILRNFVNVNTPKKAISVAKNNEYYYLKDDITKTKISYRFSKKDNEYYILTVIVEK